MSWTADFGRIASPDELDKLDDVEPTQGEELPPAAIEAINDHIEAVKEAIRALVESKAFGDYSVKVQASGSALPRHEPYGGKVERVTQTKFGEEFETLRVLDVPAVEGITITITQVAPDGLEPEDVTSDEPT